MQPITTPTAYGAVERRTLRYLEGIRVVFEKVSRILSGKPVRVRLVNGQDHNMSGFPGWTDGSDIFLNREVIEQTLAKAKGNPSQSELNDLVMMLKGVNYHELSHILYTPRTGQAGIANDVIAASQRDGIHWWYAFNALEDQRIETLFTAKYRTARKFFEAAVLKWLVGAPQATQMAHTLMHGRKYLTPVLRKNARANFVAAYGTDLADAFEAVIDRYSALTFPRNDLAGFQCVKEFRDLLLQTVPQPSQLPPQPSEDNDPRGLNGDPRVPWHDEDGTNIPRGPQPSQTDQDAAQEEAKKFDDDSIEDDANDELSAAEDAATSDDDADSQADSEGDDGDAGSDSNDEGEPGDEMPGDAAEGASGQPDQNSEQGDAEGSSTDSDDPALDGGYNGSTDDNQADDSQPGGISEGDRTAPPPDLIEAAKEALDDLLGSDDFNADIEATSESIQDIAMNSDGLGGVLAAPYVDTPIAPEAHAVVRRITQAISQMRLDLEPERYHRQVTGRLNMRRVMTHQPHEIDLFDQWDMGHEAEGGVEVVVLLDMSGSMDYIMTKASSAMWSVKQAFDQLEIRTTVLGYSDDWYVLYGPNEKASKTTFRRYGDISGTDPLEALRKAHEILGKSEHPNRVLISITDGGWANSVAANAVVESGKKLGVTSLLLGLDGAVQAHGKHCHDVAKDVYDVTEVPKAIASLVDAITAKVIRATHSG